MAEGCLALWVLRWCEFSRVVKMPSWFFCVVLRIQIVMGVLEGVCLLDDARVVGPMQQGLALFFSAI
jgi:heme A synthase